MGPAPVVLTVLALVAVAMALRGGRGSRVSVLVLAALWSWSGVVYHLGHFRAINPAAGLFGVLFLVQAAMFLHAGARERPLRFRPRMSPRAMVGGALVLYALVVYPALGWAFGDPYPATPTFGTPCPVVIFTFGLLLWSEDRVSPWLVAIPLGWSLLGGSAAFSMGLLQDLGLLIAGPVAAALLLVRASPESIDPAPAGVRASSPERF